MKGILSISGLIDTNDDQRVTTCTCTLRHAFLNVTFQAGNRHSYVLWVQDRHIIPFSIDCLVMKNSILTIRALVFPRQAMKKPIPILT